MQSQYITPPFNELQIQSFLNTSEKWMISPTLTRQWYHFFRPSSRIVNLIVSNYKMFPIRDKTEKIQEILTRNDFLVTIQHLNKFIWNQGNILNDIITTLAQLYLNYAKENQGLTLYIDQLLKW